VNKLSVIFLVGISGFNTILSAFAAEDKIIAYYFHGSYRCSTCTKIENYSKETVETYFSDALSSGRLEFQTVNVEEDGNEHFVSDYGLYTKAFILSAVKDGKEIRSKNLNKIWEYSADKEKFVGYVRDGLSSFLNKSDE